MNGSHRLIGSRRRSPVVYSFSLRPRRFIASFFHLLKPISITLLLLKVVLFLTPYRRHHPHPPLPDPLGFDFHPAWLPSTCRDNWFAPTRCSTWLMSTACLSTTCSCASPCLTTWFKPTCPTVDCTLTCVLSWVMSTCPPI